MGLITRDGVTYDKDEGGYWWRRFVAVDVDGVVTDDLEAGRTIEKWVGVTIPEHMQDVTGHQQWTGLGSLVGCRRLQDGTFAERQVPPRRVIPLGDFLSRITLTEHEKFEELMETNRMARVWWQRLIARQVVDLDHPEIVQGLAFVKSQGIPGIWADTVTADARIAALRA